MRCQPPRSGPGLLLGSEPRSAGGQDQALTAGARQLQICEGPGCPCPGADAKAGKLSPKAPGPKAARLASDSPAVHVSYGTHSCLLPLTLHSRGESSLAAERPLSRCLSPQLPLRTLEGRGPGRGRQPAGWGTSTIRVAQNEEEAPRSPGRPICIDQQVFCARPCAHPPMQSL